MNYARKREWNGEKKKEKNYSMNTHKLYACCEVEILNENIAFRLKKCGYSGYWLADWCDGGGG